jgi:NAD+-dependent secondary alcohol dehydrogenase Adh1
VHRRDTLWRREPGRLTRPILGEITVAGNLIGTHADLVGLIRLAEQGKVRLECARYPLDAAADAISDLRAGTIRGRAILTPAG